MNKLRKLKSKALIVIQGEMPQPPEIEKLVLAWSVLIAEYFETRRLEMGYTSYESFAFDHDFPRAQYWRVEDGKHNLTLRTQAKLLLIHDESLEGFFYQMWQRAKAKNEALSNEAKNNRAAHDS